eukprot:GFYU01004047.1.p1 GENE.GFYU01004047.1~~GFYU01004047.1.p1  ORF type:complete len:1795 (-),score=695.27 GFYU01004047.1:133-5517(-)
MSSPPGRGSVSTTPGRGSVATPATPQSARSVKSEASVASAASTASTPGRRAGGNVRVAARFRPQNRKEELSGGGVCVSFANDGKSVSLKVPGSKAEKGSHQFTFDNVFSMACSQQGIYEETAKPIVDDVLQGYNGTIFAYGQTSAGKTYTMEGKDVDSEQRGLIPRMVEALFDGVLNCDENYEFTVKVSFLEIYMEKIRDLLEPKNDNLQVREEKGGGVWVEGGTEIYVSDEAEVLEIMKEGANNRAKAETKMNLDSSRSHSIFIITLNQRNLDDLSVKNGKLYLVDLAGSEKISKTEVAGQQLEEAKMINKSLSTLGMVINALTDGKSTHIPYRDSKLTRVLQESLGGNSRTTLIVCASPSSYNDAETLSTLRFGERAKRIKNKPKINEQKSAKELERALNAANEEIERLKQYITVLEEQVGAVKSGAVTDIEPPSPHIITSFSDAENKGFSLLEPMSPTTRALLPNTAMLEDKCTTLEDELKQLQEKNEKLNRDKEEKDIVFTEMSNELKSAIEREAKIAQENEILMHKLADVTVLKEQYEQDIHKSSQTAVAHQSQSELFTVVSDKVMQTLKEALVAVTAAQTGDADGGDDGDDGDGDGKNDSGGASDATPESGKEAGDGKKELTPEEAESRSRQCIDVISVAGSRLSEQHVKIQTLESTERGYKAMIKDLESRVEATTTRLKEEETLHNHTQEESRAEVTQLSSENSDLQDQLKKASKELKEAVKLVEKVDKEKSELEATAEASIKELETAKQQLWELEREKNNLSDDMTMAKDKHEENLKELRDQIASMKEESTSMSSRHAETLAELEKKTADLNMAEAEKKTLAGQIEAEASAKLTLQNNIETEKEGLLLQHQQLENEKKSLTEQLTQSQATLADSSQKIATLEGQISTLKSEHEQLKDKSAANEAESARVMTVKTEEIAGLSARLEAEERMRASNNEELRGLLADVQKESKERESRMVKESSDQTEKSSAKIQGLEQENETLKLRAVERDGEVATLKEKLESAQREHEATQQRTDEDAQAKKTIINSLQSQGDSLTVELDKKSRQINDLQEEINSLNLALDAQGRDRSSSEDEFRQKLEEMKQSAVSREERLQEEHLQKLEDVTGKYTEASSHVDELTSQRQQLEAELSTAKTSLETATEKHSALEEELNAAKKETREVQSQLTSVQEQLNAQINDLQHDVTAKQETIAQQESRLAAEERMRVTNTEELKSLLASVQASSKEREEQMQSEHTAKVDAVNTKHATLQKEAEALKIQVASLETSSAGHEKESKRLEKQCTDLETQHQREQTSLNAQISRLKDIEAELTSKMEAMTADEKEKQEKIAKLSSRVEAEQRLRSQYCDEMTLVVDKMQKTQTEQEEKLIKERTRSEGLLADVKKTLADRDDARRELAQTMQEMLKASTKFQKEEEELKSKIGDLEAELKSVTEALKETEKGKTSASGEIHKLHQEMKQAKGDYAAVEELRSKLEKELTEEKQSNATLAETLRAEIARLEKTNAQKDKYLAEKVHAVVNLQQKLHENEEALDKAIAGSEEGKQMARMQQLMDEMSEERNKAMSENAMARGKLAVAERRMKLQEDATQNLRLQLHEATEANNRLERSRGRSKSKRSIRGPLGNVGQRPFARSTSVPGTQLLEQLTQLKDELQSEGTLPEGVPVRGRTGAVQVGSRIARPIRAVPVIRPANRKHVSNIVEERLQPEDEDDDSEANTSSVASPKRQPQPPLERSKSSALSLWGMLPVKTAKDSASALGRWAGVVKPLGSSSPLKPAVPSGSSDKEVVNPPPVSSPPK